MKPINLLFAFTLPFTLSAQAEIDPCASAPTALASSPVVRHAHRASRSHTPRSHRPRPAYRTPTKPDCLKPVAPGTTRITDSVVFAGPVAGAPLPPPLTWTIPPEYWIPSPLPHGDMPPWIPGDHQPPPAMFPPTSTLPPTELPEPTSFALIGIALAAFTATRKRKIT